jgi:hypothetical protein
MCRMAIFTACLLSGLSHRAPLGGVLEVSNDGVKNFSHGVISFLVGRGGGCDSQHP